MVQAKGITATQAQLYKLNRSADDTSRSVDQMASKFRGAHGALGDFNRGMTAVHHSVRLVKWPALLAGSGAAAQGLGAVGAAATAASAAMAPLAGGVAAVGVAYTAFGQASAVARLATMGLEDAIKGQKGAMDKLSPVQQAFVKQIRGLRKETQDLRGDAQRGLLPGLSEALRTISPLFQSLRPVVRATAEVMGNLAVSASRVVATWRGDMLTLGKANVTIIGNLGKAAISGANALRNLLTAAAPLTVWLSQLAARGAKWVDTALAGARASGTLAKFLAETRSVMATLGGAIGNLVAGFVNIGKAAFPLGKGLLQDFKNLTARFKEWTASATGRNTLVEYFKAAHGPIYALFGLLGDLGGALLRLSAPTPLTTDLINQMRTLVPIFERVIAVTTAALGPALIEAIGNIARLIGVFAGAHGPLTLYVQTIGFLAGALATLLEKTPGLSAMVVTLVGFKAVLAATTFLVGPLGVGLRALGAAYLFVSSGALKAKIATTAVTVSIAAQRAVAIASATAIRVLTAAQWLLNVAMRANPIGIVITALTLLGTALVVAYKKSETFRNIVNGAWNAVRSATTAAFNAIVGTVKTAWNTISGIFRDIGPKLSGFIRGAIGLVTSAGKALGQGVINGFKSAFDLAKAIVTAVRNVISQAASWGIGVGRKLVDGIKDGIRDAFGGVGSLISGLVGKIGIGDAGRRIGDGLGVGAKIPSGAKGGGGLKGAGAHMRPFAAIGSKFGLTVSSGLRPGAVTSSGKPSHHATGNAIDLWDGTPGASPAKMAAFKALQRYSGQLAELIYTPGGAYSNGTRYTPTGALAADHYDHIHVAYKGGGTGDGPGMALRAGRAAGIGDGLGIDEKGKAVGSNILSLAKKVWKAQAPLMGKSARIPPTMEIGDTGSAWAWAEREKHLVRLSPNMNKALQPGAKNRSDALKALVHEFAHIGQRFALGRREVEGGAESFAQTHWHKIMTKLGISGLGPAWTAYPSEVAWVGKNRNPKWIFHDQFDGPEWGLGGPTTGAKKALASPRPNGGQGPKALIAAAAKKYGIDPAILWGLYGAESNFGKNLGPSSAGARGPFQFMPETAKAYGIDPMNFKQAAFAAAKYLGTYKSRGTAGMLAAYNAGPAGNPNNPETRAYIPKVKNLAKTWTAPGGKAEGGKKTLSKGAANDKVAALKKTLSAGLDKLDALRNKVRNLPAGKKSEAMRKALRNKIAAQLTANRKTREKIAATKALVGDTSKDASQVITPLERSLAGNDLLQAMAGSDVAAQAKALQARSGILGKRIDKIRKDLGTKGKIKSPATRHRLTQELASHLNEQRTIGEQYSSLYPGVDTSGGGGDGSDPNQGLIDSNAALQEQIEKQIAADKEHTDALNAVKAEVKRQTDFATSATATTNYQAWKALADILSGQIVGRGVTGRAFTPGYGVESRF